MKVRIFMEKTKLSVTVQGKHTISDTIIKSLSRGYVPHCPPPPPFSSAQSPTSYSTNLKTAKAIDLN